MKLKGKVAVEDYNPHLILYSENGKLSYETNYKGGNEIDF